MKKILIIYTGGTIGMVHDVATNALRPFDFERINSQVPELSRFEYELSVHSFSPLIDSSNMNPQTWIELVKLIERNYEEADGFVILHGTDTMSYTASALSFMLENLSKPVVLTGSQLPIGAIRTDAKENFITSIEIAASGRINEVCIFFNSLLVRGNRSSKISSSKFEAFSSPNFPPLAEAGVHLNYFANYKSKETKTLTAHTSLNTNIALVKLYPGITGAFIECILSIPGLKAIVLETFGAGNGPTSADFLALIEKAIKKDLVIYNVTQCKGGSVELGKYETSVKLKEIGVVSGRDITTEAAVTKLMFVLGQNLSKEETKSALEKNLRGEISTES